MSLGLIKCHFSCLLDCLFNAQRTEGLIALSVLWIQPIQQQGRRFPALSSETTRFTCSSLVFCCFTVTVQQIHSLRANGVKLSHTVNALELAASASFRSFGNLCATPPAILFCFMFQFYPSLKTLLYFNHAKNSYQSIYLRINNFWNFRGYYGADRNRPR